MSRKTDGAPVDGVPEQRAGDVPEDEHAGGRGVVPLVVPGIGSGGDEDDDDVRSFLGSLVTTHPRSVDLTPTEMRRRHLAGAQTQWAKTGEPVFAADLRSPGGTPVRWYRQAVSEGVTVFVHGGGWVTGTLDSYDDLARLIADRAGTEVVSVGYGLAPEHPLTDQLAQLTEVCEWVVRSSGVEIALAGDSAGAYLCARTARMLPGVVRRVALLYPVVSPRLEWPSVQRYGTGFRLEVEVLRWFWDQAEPDVPRRVDLLDEAAGGPLPPTLVIVGGKDPLHDEGVALANALHRVGTEVGLVDFLAQIHGFTRIPRIRQHVPSIDVLARHLRVASRSLAFPRGES